MGFKISDLQIQIIMKPGTAQSTNSYYKTKYFFQTEQVHVDLAIPNLKFIDCTQCTLIVLLKKKNKNLNEKNIYFSYFCDFYKTRACMRML